MSSEGTLLRLELDPSSNYVATSSSDKTMNIYDFFSGECFASMFGHSEISPGIKFLNDMKHFVSVSADGYVEAMSSSLNILPSYCSRVI